jgi:hypothetical protein
VIGTDNWMSESPFVRTGVACGQTESGGIVLAVICWARGSRGGVTRQGFLLTSKPVPNRIPSSEFRVQLLVQSWGRSKPDFLEFLTSSSAHQRIYKAVDLDGRGDARCRRARRRGIGPGCLPTEVGGLAGRLSRCSQHLPLHLLPPCPTCQ